MLGAYVSLFVSWWLGFTPEATSRGNMTSSWLNVGLMLLASMVICALIGLIIEFFAYRPMRNQPRIAALITAIGVSLLIQYGGSLFLPVAPQPVISEQVNPLRGTWEYAIVKPDSSLVANVNAAKAKLDTAEAAFAEQLKHEKGEFDLTQAGLELRTAKQKADREYSGLNSRLKNSGINVLIPKGQFVMLVISIVLMLLLRQLVMGTAVGRAMRAVSHDFDSASLMGVSVNKIVMITFVIGSALAGAGAMMTATFIGTPMTTFFGMAPGVKAFVAAVLGGIGNIPGAVLGGLLMGVAENLVVWAGYSQYRDAIAMVILIIVLLFRPGGLLGSSKVEKV